MTTNETKCQLRFDRVPMFPFRYICGHEHEVLTDIEVPTELYHRIHRWHDELYDISHELSLITADMAKKRGYTKTRKLTLVDS